MRVPPHSVEGEQSLLGALLLDADAFDEVAAQIKADDFYKESHRHIYRAMEQISIRKEAIDVVTLVQQLRDEERLDAVGGIAYIASLSNAVATAANVTHYAGLVRKKSLLRRVIQLSTETAESCYGDVGDVEAFINEAEAKLLSLASEKATNPVRSLKDVVRDAYYQIEALYEKEESITGVPSGFVDLDYMTAGWQSSDLIIVAARPAMGKTAFTLNMACNSAMRFGRSVLFCSLEMSATQLAMRLMASEARVDVSRLRTGGLKEHEWSRLISATASLSKASIFIDDTAGLTPQMLSSRARRLKVEHGLDMIMIDYLQLMNTSSKTQSREQQISEVSRTLKMLAKELHIPVMALAQLNRGVEARADKRPMLSDLRECVTGDTLVLLADGRRVPIRGLVGQRPTVWAMDEREKLVAVQSDAVWSVGAREVLELALSSGRRLRATAQHRIYTGRGWLTVGELVPGDRAALARRTPAPADPERWEPLRLVLLAHLMGDGSYLKGQPIRYTTASEENSQAVAQAASQVFGAQVKRYEGRGQWHQLLLSGNGTRWAPAGVNLWLRELGVFGQRSHEKRAPEALFRLGEDQIAFFLKHLWATDGTIFTPNTPRTSSKISLSTSSLGLAWDVAALLSRLGMVARLRVMKQGAHRPCYGVELSGRAQQQRFLDVVGAFGPRAPQAEALRAHLERIEENTNVDTLPREVFARVKELMEQRGLSQREMARLRGTSYGGSAHFSFAPSRAVLSSYNEVLRDPGLTMKCESDLFWDEVLEVLPAGREEVFDLTVPGPASWLADGIVSHNSGAIEQDADIISFVYRDEYYNPESDKKGIAEIIIGKHRSGSTGTVELRFFPEFTRFENLARDGQDG